MKRRTDENKMKRKNSNDTYCVYILDGALFPCINLHRVYFAVVLISGPAMYSVSTSPAVPMGRKNATHLGQLTLKTRLILFKKYNRHL